MMSQRCFSSFNVLIHAKILKKWIWRDKSRHSVTEQWKTKKNESEMVSFGLGFAIELNWNFGYVTLNCWYWKQKVSGEIFYHFTWNEVSVMTPSFVTSMAKWEWFMDFFHLRRHPEEIPSKSLKYWECNKMSGDCPLIAWDIFLSVFPSWPSPLIISFLFPSFFLPLFFSLSVNSFCSTQESWQKCVCKAYPWKINISIVVSSKVGVEILNIVLLRYLKCLGN